MINSKDWLEEHSKTALKRLFPRIEARFKDKTDPAEWEAFSNRVRRYFPKMFERLYALYGSHYDFYYHLESILASVTQMWLDRPGELKALDAMREADPNWYQSNRMVGAMCYVDLFTGDLEGLRQRKEASS